MLNSVTLVGRLTADPELRYTSNGIPVANFTLACGRDFKNAQGEYETDFISCVTWKATAELMANTLKKGSLISVIGRLETRNYDTEDRRVYVTELNVDKFHYLEKKAEPEKPVTNNRYQSRR